MNSTGVTGAQKVSWLAVVSCCDSFNHVWSQIVLGVAIFSPLSWTFTNQEVINHFLSVLLTIVVLSSE